MERVFNETRSSANLSNDDIRFSIQESGPPEQRIFAADQTSFLLTPEQAEQLAIALKEAGDESRGMLR